MKGELHHPSIPGIMLKTANKYGLLPIAVPSVSLSCSVATAASPPKSNTAEANNGLSTEGRTPLIW